MSARPDGIGCPPVFGSALSEDDAAELADVLKALADPARLRLVSIIASSPAVRRARAISPARWIAHSRQ